MGDVNNHYDTLDRSLKKLGIVLVDDLGLLRNGKASQCVDLLRKLLLGTSVPLAKMLLQRGCPSHATDKKLVSAAFELIRDKVKFLPSLTVDQFFKEGFAAHKLAILVKLAGYIQELDKSFSRGTPSKVMYVVPTQVGVNTTIDSNESATEEGNNEFSGLDDSELADGDEQPLQPQQKYRYPNLTKSLSMPPPPSQSSNRSSVSSSQAEWPQTDFIKKHILDSKLKSAARIVPSPHGNSRGTVGSGSGRASSAPRGGSNRHSSHSHSHSNTATPSSSRKVRRDDDESGTATGIDIGIYDPEEKAAALEAIQALRAARNQSHTHSLRHRDSGSGNNSVSVSRLTSALSAPITTPSTYNDEPMMLSPRVAADGTTLSELAAADVHGAIQSQSSGGGRNSTGGGFTTAEPTGELKAFIQSAVDAAVTERLANDPAVQQVIDSRVEALVQARLQQTVQELTTKYDFIINKLVAAVDAEFTLLNNKLALSQQFPSTNMSGSGTGGSLASPPQQQSYSTGVSTEQY